MPTVRNILNIQGGGAKANALLDFIADRRYGRGSMDFNHVTPMPPWVYRQPTNLALLEKYGEKNCARGWCLENWGTPQNVLRPEKSAREYDGGSTIRFDTEDRDGNLSASCPLCSKTSCWTTSGPVKMWGAAWGRCSIRMARLSSNLSPPPAPGRRWKSRWIFWAAGLPTTD